MRVPMAAGILAAAVLAIGHGTAGDGPVEQTPRRRLHAVRATSPGWHDDRTLAHGGLARAFRYYVPATLGEHPALVLLLHGGTQSMRDIFKPTAGGTQGWPLLADEAGFVLLVPNGVDPESGSTTGDHQHWNDCRADVGLGDSSADDVGFLSALIEWAATTFAADRSRIYATGGSNGGGMSFRLAIERPGTFAAVAVFVMNLAAASECPAPPQPVPVFICNGTDDPLVPWAGGGVTGGTRGTVVSAQATLAAWLAADLAGPEPAEVVTFPDADANDGCTVVERRYLPAVGGAEVAFLTVEGGGHTVPSRSWPVPGWLLSLGDLGRQNRDVEGIREAWAFLARQRLARPGLTP